MIEVKKINLKDDIDVIVNAIKNSSWAENSEIEPTDYSAANIEKSLNQENCIFCIANYNGQFAGMASAFFMSKPDGNIWLYVDEVDVCADKQRNGVGTALMRFLFAEADKGQCDEVWLGTEKDNMSANALYQSLDPSDIEDFIGYTYKFK